MHLPASILYLWQSGPAGKFADAKALNHGAFFEMQSRESRGSQSKIPEARSFQLQGWILRALLPNASVVASSGRTRILVLSRWP
jgi:hypothetical protein